MAIFALCCDYGKLFDVSFDFLGFFSIFLRIRAGDHRDGPRSGAASPGGCPSSAPGPLLSAGRWVSDLRDRGRRIRAGDRLGVPREPGAPPRSQNAKGACVNADRKPCARPIENRGVSRRMSPRIHPGVYAPGRSVFTGVCSGPFSTWFQSLTPWFQALVPVRPTLSSVGVQAGRLPCSASSPYAKGDCDETNQRDGQCCYDEVIISTRD